MYVQFLIRLISKPENKVQLKSKNYKLDSCDIGELFISLPEDWGNEAELSEIYPSLYIQSTSI